MLRTRRNRTLSIGAGRLRLEGSGTVRIDWSLPTGYSMPGYLEMPYEDTNAVGFSIPRTVWEDEDEDLDDDDED